MMKKKWMSFDDQLLFSLYNQHLFTINPIGDLFIDDDCISITIELVSPGEEEYKENQINNQVFI